MKITGKNFIGFRRAANGNQKFTAQNPATGASVDGEFIEATHEEINQAIELAATAFLSYGTKSGIDKSKFLEAIAQQIIDLGDVLIERCMLETGLPLARLQGERGRTVNQLKLFATYLSNGSWVDARIDHADAMRTLPKPDLRSMQKPLGPVGIFGASNFPLAFSVAGGDTVSALAAGCPVIFKGHPAHPGTSELVAAAILEAAKKTGMPEGTFSLVHGRSHAVGEAIVRHPLIKAIGFTGSFRGGKALFDLAQKRDMPIPVYAEMGSTNPVFILAGALKEKKEIIARDLSSSVTLGTGQFCTNPGLVFLDGNVDGNGFVESMKTHIESCACGPMLTQDIQRSFNTGVQKFSSYGIEVSAKGKNQDTGFSVSPHLFVASAGAFLNDHRLEEELFGPSSVAVICDDREQLLHAARKLSGHLTATIHGTEADLASNRELIGILEQKVGRLIINGYPTGVEVAHAMVHGGPFPSTTDSRSTSVGTNAILRFTRPICYQNFPDSLLPDELKENNPLRISRLVDGKLISGA
jgi:2,5-dioxopentanoate dehydrogenase